GRRRWLLIRRPLEDPGDLAYYLAYGPEVTPLQELAQVCDRRWASEEDFAEAKGEVGLAQYEVRTWTAWRRFITLGLLTHAALIALRQRARAEEDSLREPTAPKGARVRPRTANRARRPTVAPRDTRAGRAAVVPAGVVGVATGAPGCGRALPGHAADAPRSA